MTETDPAPTTTAAHGGKGAPMRRLMWNILGCAALALGLIGVVLPVLPTTPFVILAAFAFSNGSPRLRNWLTSHRVFGPLIAEWEAYGAIPRPVKRLACAVMALAFGASLLAGLPTVVLIVQALALGAAATYVLTRPDGPR
ncbi:YbaN family protein [Sedimentitalea sp. HM32M-2]|uniref:YbaN family protein n=1 Tax=Sedimentitalea sp. HM32M-2 TaxID=3351566 RepID=UPI0036272CB5